MRTGLGKLRWWAWRLAVPAVGLAAFAQLGLAGSASATHAAAAGQHLAGTIAPGKFSMLDCNGHSPVYKLIAPSLAAHCTDPHGKRYFTDRFGRFYDNGHYVGHDEPSVKFISSLAGSGNTMSYGMRLPRDPASAPTATGSVTGYGELSIAPWFGLPMCDPHSYPQNPCKPDSDANSGSAASPAAAGSAFMELQFYPPGFTPFIDNLSCSKTQWCAALTIDSLECTFNFASCNNNCIEPINFSYLQTNGIPPGPPAPQDPSTKTFLGNASTLKMNSGDVLKVSITDPRAGFTATVKDLTTGKTGHIVASAKNGFTDTNIADCSGNHFTWHAEYSTAKKQNQVPWAALEGGVLMEQEIGHGESCASLSSKEGFSAAFAGGSSYKDPNVFQVCNGGTEGAGKKGEGPCNISTGTCVGSQTQGPAGPVPCTSASRACEFSDGFCFPRGTRTAFVNGVAVKESEAVTECLQNQFENGDADFDGLSYQPDWPDGSPHFPQAFRYVGPFTNGHTYPNIQYETDAAASENLCDTGTGVGCTAPPISAAFYPFWSMNTMQTLKGIVSSHGACIWNFGNDIKGVTKTDFGKDKQYGKPDLARFAGTLTSPVLSNPALAAGCKPVHLP